MLAGFFRNTDSLLCYFVEFALECRDQLQTNSPDLASCSSEPLCATQVQTQVYLFVKYTGLFQARLEL